MHHLSLSHTITMSSREIAELVESRHDNVMRTIERLAGRGVVTSPPMEEIYKDNSGRSYNMYKLGKRDSLIVVAQLSPEFTARVVDRWQELEAQAAKPALPGNYIEALEALLESKKSEAALTATIQENAPKVEFHDAVTETENDKSILEVGKTFGIGQNTLFTILKDLGILMRSNLPYQRHIDAGRFKVATKLFADGTKTYQQTRVTGKGQVFIYSLLREHGILQTNQKDERIL